LFCDDVFGFGDDEGSPGVEAVGAFVGVAYLQNSEVLIELIPGAGNCNVLENDDEDCEFIGVVEELFGEGVAEEDVIVLQHS
jgi:hypothetical protein